MWCIWLRIITIKPERIDTKVQIDMNHWCETRIICESSAAKPYKRQTNIDNYTIIEYTKVRMDHNLWDRLLYSSRYYQNYDKVPVIANGEVGIGCHQIIWACQLPAPNASICFFGNFFIFIDIIIITIIIIIPQLYLLNNKTLNVG